MKKNYFNAYTKFTKKNYPLFYDAKISNAPTMQLDKLKNTINNLYKIIFNINLLEQHCEDEDIFLSEIHQLVFRIFQVIPLNDQYLLDILFRALSEAMLRLIITNSRHNNVNLKMAQKLSFTDIKKIVILDNYIFRRKIKFVYLYNLFSVCSISLHNPSEKMEKIDYLDDQLTINLNYKSLNSRVLEINKVIYNLIIPDIYKIKYSDLTLSERINISKMMNKSEILSFKKLL
ncbi:hypothetical protein DIS15_03465 [Levilactobacillus brevis]|uniref:hypothetical protein n=1 Tax=Levilactobacillus brevis TaxID=1580 RepID=UPI001122EA23|nr:hypothetical protein [Levilactobacillus brevis]TOY85854.1 hypothetical protein DIS15_03465 [Levilactobacillus brevis]